MTRIVYAGYDFFSGCLGRLLDIDRAEVVLCLTGTLDEPVDEVLRLTMKGSIPVYFGRPGAEIIDLINRLDVDLLISAAYSYRLPVVELRVEQAVNIHSTLLPFGRGPNPLPYLVDGQQQFAGVTAHLMDEEFDHGPVLAQRAVEVAESDGFDELALKVLAVAADLTTWLVERFPVPVAAGGPSGNGSYWPLPPVSQRSFQARSASVAAVRALAAKFGSSGIVAELPDGTCLRSPHVVAVACDHSFPTGSVVSRAPRGWIVALDDGLVRLDTFEPPPSGPA